MWSSWDATAQDCLWLSMWASVSLSRGNLCQPGHSPTMLSQVLHPLQRHLCIMQRSKACCQKQREIGAPQQQRRLPSASLITFPTCTSWPCCVTPQTSSQSIKSPFPDHAGGHKLNGVLMGRRYEQLEKLMWGKGTLTGPGVSRKGLGGSLQHGQDGKGIPAS